MAARHTQCSSSKPAASLAPPSHALASPSTLAASDPHLTPLPIPLTSQSHLACTIHLSLHHRRPQAVTKCPFMSTHPPTPALDVHPARHHTHALVRLHLASRLCLAPCPRVSHPGLHFMPHTHPTPAPLASPSPQPRMWTPPLLLSLHCPTPSTLLNLALNQPPPAPPSRCFSCHESHHTGPGLIRG